MHRMRQSIIITMTMMSMSITTTMMSMSTITTTMITSITTTMTSTNTITRHGDGCTCGCHDHDHEHGHHHADDVFTSWGKETPHKFERAKLEEILKQFVEDDKILRSKGMVEGTDGKWIYFDMVPGEYEIRDGEPDYTGRIVVIGTDIHEHELEELFGLA